MSKAGTFLLLHDEYKRVWLYRFKIITRLIVLFILLDEIKVNKKQQQTPSSASVMQLVSTNRQGVTKQVKRLQGRLGPGKSKATVKDKRIKSAVGQWAQFTAQQYSEECISRCSSPCWFRYRDKDVITCVVQNDRKQAFCIVWTQSKYCRVSFWFLAFLP